MWQEESFGVDDDRGVAVQTAWMDEWCDCEGWPVCCWRQERQRNILEMDAAFENQLESASNDGGYSAEYIVEHLHVEEFLRPDECRCRDSARCLSFRELLHYIPQPVGVPSKPCSRVYLFA